MKELKKALICVLICQLICWGIFIFLDETGLIYLSTSEEMLLLSPEGVALLSSVIILFILLILYIIFESKFVIKNNLNSIKFNISLYTLWFITTLLIFRIIVGFYVCDGAFLDGIEYVIQVIFMIIFVIVMGALKLIVTFFKYIIQL